VETLTRSILEWHTESAPHPSETLSGDTGSVVLQGHTGFAFALDALGHGPEAARTAASASEFLATASPSDSLEGLFLQCHQQLRDTRGVALCLARIDAGTDMMSWLSVGNIQAVHIQLDRQGLPNYESLIMRGGVVGDRLPELKASHTRLFPGDVIVLASDGIEYGWQSEFRADISPRELASALMNRHRLLKDDALVTVMRYQGRSGGVDDDG